MGVWVTFLKHPDALPGGAPIFKFNFFYIIHKKIKNESKVVQKYIFDFLGGARLDSASGCFKNATQPLNAGHCLYKVPEVDRVNYGSLSSSPEFRQKLAIGSVKNSDQRSFI
jgi:hypothetical protein